MPMSRESLLCFEETVFYWFMEMLDVISSQISNNIKLLLCHKIKINTGL